MPFLIDTPAHPESNKLYSTQGPFPPTKDNIMKNGFKKKKRKRKRGEINNRMGLSHKSLEYRRFAIYQMQQPDTFRCVRDLLQ